jgi:uncharacterized protein DUF11
MRGVLIALLLVATVAAGGTIAAAKPRPAADLSVAIAAAADPVGVGQTAEWTVTVANRGPSRATSVVLALRTAGGAESVAASGPACGSTGATTVTCRLEALRKGARVAVALQAKATATDSLTTSASVSTKTRDPHRGNNAASHPIRVLGPDSVQGHGVRPTYRPGGGSPFRVSVDVDATSAFDGTDATGTFATLYPNGDPELRGHVICLTVAGNRAMLGGIIDFASGSNVALTPPGSGVLLSITDNGDPGVGHDTEVSYIGTPVDDARLCKLGDQSLELPLTDGNFAVHDEQP